MSWSRREKKDRRSLREADRPAKAEETKDLSALYTILEPLAPSDTMGQMFERVIERVLQVTGADAVLIRTRDAGETFVCASQRGFPDYYLKRTQAIMPASAVAQVLIGGEPILSPDIGADPRLKGKIQLQVGLRSCAFLPLRISGELRGIIHVASHELGYFNEQKKEQLMAIARQMGIALENWELLDQSERRAGELAALNTVAAAVSGSLDLDNILEKSLHAVLLVTGMEAGYIRLLEGEPPRLSIKVHKGISPEHIERLQSGTRDGGKAAQVLSTKRSLIFEDVQNRHGDLRDIRTGGFTAAAWIPMISKDSVVGIINLATHEAGAFLRDQIPLLEAVGASLGVAIENARLYEKVGTKSEELGALVKVNRDVAALCDREVLLPRIAEEARRILKVDSSVFRLVEGDSLVLVSGSDQNLDFHPRLQINESLSGKIVQENRVIAIKNVLEDPTIIEGHREVIRKAGYHSFLGIPLRIGDRVIGTINFYCKEEREFQPEEISLVTAFADQAAVAIENANLYRQSRRGAEIQKLLKELSQDITSIDLESLLKRLTANLSEILKVDVSDVRVLRDGKWCALGISGLPQDAIPESRLDTEKGRSAWILKNRKPLVASDITKETEISRGRTLAAFGFRGYLGVPLLARDGEAVGVLRVLTYQPREFTQEEIDLLQQCANGATIALENARLFKETELRAQEQAVLNSIAMAVNQSLHLDELLQISLNKVLDVTGRERGYIRLKDPVTGELRLAAHRGISQDYVETLLHHRTPGGKTDQVFQSGEPLIINDPEGTLLKEETRREGSRSMAWIPLKARRGVVGILSVSTNRPIPFEDREVNLLLTIGNVIGVALENAQLFEDSERLVRELEATTEQLSAKNRELDSFVYTVSHDLKAPLISLEGMAALLLDEYAGKLDEGAQHYLKRLMASSKQMETLIIDLLTLSRIGREGRPPEEVSLNQVVDDLILEWGETIRARKIRVTRHELPTLWGVPTQIQQVMTNLVSNAVKYLGDPADPMIEIGARDGGDTMVECYVRDNGIGIDPQYHEKIFETFQRLKEIETEGTGVGLAIVKKIAEGAGGRIWVESAKGEGAVLRFTWPKRQTEVRS